MTALTSAEPPLRNLEPAEIRALDEDGVIMARGLFPDHWIRRMTIAVDHICAVGTTFGALVSMPDKGFTNDLFIWTEDNDFKAFVFESPAALIAEQVLGSKTVTHWYDQLFVKKAGDQVLPTVNAGA